MGVEFLLFFLHVYYNIVHSTVPRYFWWIGELFAFCSVAFGLRVMYSTPPYRTRALILGECTNDHLYHPEASVTVATDV
jgi:hypothetical protein